MHRKSFLVIIAIILLFLTASCSAPKEEMISKNDFLLNTVVSVRLYDVDKEAETIIDDSFKLISELEGLLSVHVEGSDLDKLKDNSGRGPVEVSKYTIEVIERSLEYSEITDGRFDITAGPLIDLWRINPPEGYVPSNDEVIEVQKHIDYRKVIVDKEKRTVELLDEDMVPNLGAIAKGYIADKVKDLLVERGIEHAIINLGGNILLVGDRPVNQDFRIGVQDPDAPRNSYIGVINATDKSIVSSGDYERYFERDGIRYHHILDPFTGYPTDNEIRQVSIVSEESMDGDALSTVIFLMGLDKGLEIINSMENVEAIFVTKEHELVITQGLKDSFDFDENNYGDKYEVIYR
ncbi:FAD:protein FMN transferase [Alkalibacter saccharofermentans]|uniref:FAD:protein FMN transferase n=1 Tax=Alkalibacter saccharofermentans DSM 14828 TaxID=1120975 RepID=A0A1M4YXP2_9FIRM|nr:FAD:protein FMN transferase [Alkalibacter saccharofermentans]SHF10485.1 thiamine biosynthesis lipoprotein [Alkalibacter saccharofermentans DSM 14828]